MKKIIIAAVARNGVIGKAGKILWHSDVEFRHFKNTTFGFPIIMGRKTFESLINPLNGRTNIVLSKDPNFIPPDESVKVFNDLEKAYLYCEKVLRSEKVFIIGGGEIFNQSINEADELLISNMNFEADGDVYFPDIDLNKWKEVSNVKFADFTIVNYKRKEK
ncbi:MAG: dihydrofolate reductase [Ignavibacteriales bacterium]|nr:dihydrofolate reductase [Ignavibacteriales bacterium]